MKVRLAEDEYSAVVVAAGVSGLTVAGFVAEAALSTAKGERSVLEVGVLREALAELAAARGLVRRYGVLVNQAVARLHAVGEPPPWLERVVGRCDAAVARLDRVAAVVGERTR